MRERLTLTAAILGGLGYIVLLQYWAVQALVR